MRRKAKKLFWIAVLVILGLQLLPFRQAQQNEAQAATTPDNTYALCLSTGASALDVSKLQYIAVSYTDTDGVSRTHYMMPDTMFDRSDAIAETAAETDSVRTNLAATIGYTLSYDSGADFPAYSLRTLLFSPDYNVAAIDSVQFLTKSAGKWTCEGLRVYQVEKLYGKKGIAAASAEQYVEFSGTLLLATEDTESLSWGSFELVRFGLSSTATVQLVRDGSSTYDNRTDSEYVVRLDIADEYRAGLEALAAEYQDGKAGITSLQEAELLKIRIVYEDIYGARRSVTVPVISNVIAYAIECGVDMSDANPILGLASQGETLAMKVNLPDFAALYSSTDKSGNTTSAAVYISGGDDLTDTGLSLKSSTGRTAQRAQRAKSASDSIAFTGVSLYNVSSVTDDAKNLTRATVSVHTENNLLCPEFNGDPLYYHTAVTEQGDTVTSSGSETTFSMNAYTSGAALTPTATVKNEYVIELTTSSVDLAGTKNNISFTLSYVDVSGTERTTEAYDVQTLVNSYYGYWPSSGSNYAYLKGASNGGTLRFVITLSSVDYFTGATFSLDGKDEWQMSDMAIYTAETLESRVGTFADSKVGTVQSHVNYERTFTGTKVYGASNLQVLVEGGSDKEFSFTSSEVTTANDVNWSEKQYAMSYEDACKDLALMTAAYSYTVEVNVADDTQADTQNGDSGSQNQFFFRLQFANGSSSYVLANQQIGSDGFRAGQTETFTISTNRDYGDVTAVQIVPETKNDDEFTYDKLNIDSIRVVENSKTAMSKTWTVSSVGWIGPDYEDPGVETGMRAQKGSYEAELAKTYKVDYSTNVANLLFCLSTDTYEDSAGNEVEQFEGAVSIVVWYVSTTGETKSTEYDIVRYMYEYMGKSVPTSDSTVSGTISDKEYMFRGNHTDRFILPIADVQSITRVDFYPTSTNGTTWTVKGLSVQTISETGSRYLNDNDEYIYTGTTEPLCSNAEILNAMVCPMGARQEGIKVSMTENQLVIDEESTEWVSVVSREPISKRDSLNIYLYMNSGADAVSGYELTTEIEYTNTWGKSLRTAARTMTVSSSEQMVYTKGLEVKELDSLNLMKVSCTSDRSCNAELDYAVIQQVRSGVVIGTYYVYFNGQDPGSTNLTASANPGGKNQESTEYQVVTLAFGGTTEDIQLVAQNRDIAVAITYVSSIGSADSAETEYDSPYIFLTDQEVTELYSGQMVDLVFRQSYVKEITGIKLVPSGQLSADLTGAIVATYDGTEADLDADPTGWYSFTGLHHLEVQKSSSLGTTTLTDPVVGGQSSADELTAVTMTFATAAAAADYESGTATPIRMQLTYTAANGSTQLYEVDDITKVASKDSSFATGGTATLRFMLSGLKQIKSVVLEPYDLDAGNTASWTLQTLTVKTRSASGVDLISREVGKRFVEGKTEDAVVYLSDLVLDTAVKVRKANESSYSSTYNAADEDVNLLTENGEILRILPELSGSSEGYSYRLERVDSGGASMELSISGTAGFTIDGSKYLTVDTASVAAGSYRITVYANENQDIKTVIRFTKPQEETQEETQEPETESSGGETETAAAAKREDEE